MKYICSDYNGKCYLRGLCCAREDYSGWETLETNFNANNIFLNDEGRPIHRVINGKIVYEPLKKSKEEIDAEKMKEDKELYIAAMPDLVKTLEERIAALEKTGKEMAK